MERRQRGWLFAALGMLFVSTDSFFIRWSEQDSWTINLWVAGFSLVLYTTLAAATRRSSGAGTRTRSRAAVGPIVAVTVGATLSQLAFVTAVTRTEVANVVVIVAASPMLAALFAKVLFGEATSRRVLVAIGITFSGVLLVVARSVGEPSLDGDLLALAAVAVFALNINLWRRWPEMSRVLVLGSSAIVIIVISALAGAVYAIDGRALVAFVGMGLVCNPLGRLLHTNAPKYAPASEVAMFTPIETVAASIWAWIGFSEVPDAWTVVGGAVVIAGMLYGTVGLRRPAGTRMMGRP